MDIKYLPAICNFNTCPKNALSIDLIKKCNEISKFLKKHNKKKDSNLRKELFKCMQKTGYLTETIILPTENNYEPQYEIYCPLCDNEGIQIDNTEYICPKCNLTFTVKEKVKTKIRPKFLKFQFELGTDIEDEVLKKYNTFIKKDKDSKNLRSILELLSSAVNRSDGLPQYIEYDALQIYYNIKRFYDDELEYLLPFKGKLTGKLKKGYILLSLYAAVKIRPGLREYPINSIINLFDENYDNSLINNALKNVLYIFNDVKYIKDALTLDKVICDFHIIINKLSKKYKLDFEKSIIEIIQYLNHKYNYKITSNTMCAIVYFVLNNINKTSKNKSIASNEGINFTSLEKYCKSQNSNVSSTKINKEYKKIKQLLLS